MDIVYAIKKRLSKSGKDKKTVSTCGYCRSHRRKPSFPLEGTAVPTWGNCCPHQGELSFPRVETGVSYR